MNYECRAKPTSLIRDIAIPAKSVIPAAYLISTFKGKDMLAFSALWTKPFDDKILF